MEDEATFNRYKNEYGFVGEFNMDVMARPEVSTKYFFNDKEFNTMTWNFTNYNRKRSRVDGGSRRKIKRRKTRKVRRRKHY
jgi:hypothetical protein